MTIVAAIVCFTFGELVGIALLSLCKTSSNDDEERW